MARRRYLCGYLALGVGAFVLGASSAQSRPAACGSRVVHVGPVSATGCWHHSGSRWTGPSPVTLDGLRLAGGGTFTIDTRAKTIVSSRSARWTIGSVQFLRAPVLLHIGRTLTFSPTGAVKGLKFTGKATLVFAAKDGGTATLSANLALPTVAGGVSGGTTLSVGRRHGFDVRTVDVSVGSFGVGRLAFEHVDFHYGADVWKAAVAVRLPAFSASAPTLDAAIEIAHGALHDIAVTGKGLSIPLGGGFILTQAGLDLGLGPLVIQGKGTASYGPPIAGRGALEIDGELQYSAQPERWEATGTVTLPWSLPGVKPQLSAGLEVHPGRAMLFSSDLNLTVHGIGVTGSLDGFASAHAFNAEGSGALKVPLWRLSGTALVSSRGMSACGKVSFLAFSKKLGFGLPWNGSLDLFGSSCDVGRYRVTAMERTAFAAADAPIELDSSPAGFSVFKATGGEYEVSGPTGTFDSTLDHDDASSFAYHDPTDDTTYLAIPTEPGAYTVTPLLGATLTGVSVANGLVTHQDAGDITAGVTPGSPYTLNYGLNTSDFQSGETVSFFQGQSPDIAGAEPIVQDVTTSGVATFTPEPLGQTDRYVFAVVSIDGNPRETYQVAAFTSTPVDPPSGAVFLRNAGRGWNLQFFKQRNVALWQVQTTAADGASSYQEIPAAAGGVAIPPTAATPVEVDATPVDAYGRAGPTYGCTTAKPGSCPAK